MKVFIVKWEWQIAVAAIAVALVISGLRFGWQGLTGMTLGIAATWLNLWVLSRVTWLLGAYVRGSQSPKGGANFIITAFLLKLPVFIALGLFARMIGGYCLPCFLTGLGMVYFGLIGWACAHSQRPA